MTIDTDKLKALALAAHDQGAWPFNESAFRKAANPATVLELIAEVERLRADAARIDFMITDECQIERMDRIGTAPVYRVRWPWLEEQQAEWSASGRDAIDAAIEARTKAKRDTK